MAAVDTPASEQSRSKSRRVKPPTKPLWRSQRSCAPPSASRLENRGLRIQRLRIRVSLWRYRKFFEIKCPFRGCLECAPVRMFNMHPRIPHPIIPHLVIDDTAHIKGVRTVATVEFTQGIVVVLAGLGV